MPTSSYWPLPRSELYRWPGGGGGGGGAPKTQKRKNPKNAADTMSEATAIVSEAEEGSVLRRRVPAARTVAIDSGGSDTPPEDSSRGHQVFLEAPLPHTNTGLPTFGLGHASNSRSKLRPQRHPLVGAAGTMVPQSVAPDLTGVVYPGWAMYQPGVRIQVSAAIFLFRPPFFACMPARVPLPAAATHGHRRAYDASHTQLQPHPVTGCF